MSSKSRVGLLGAGILGRTVVAQLDGHPEYEPVCFFDDAEGSTSVEGLPVLGRLEAAAGAHKEAAFDVALIAIGYKHLRLRAQLFDGLKRQGIRFATLVHPSAFVHPRALVDEGAIVFPRCVVDAGCRIGVNTVLNTACVIAHDTSVGAHSFLGPGVTLAGFVRVESLCFVGVSTVVIDHVTLGEGCRTGGGAVVTTNVAPGVLVVGVPARVVI